MASLDFIRDVKSNLESVKSQGFSYVIISLQTDIKNSTYIVNNFENVREEHRVVISQVLNKKIAELMSAETAPKKEVKEKKKKPPKQ